MKAFVPVCLYSNGFFLVKENVRKFLRYYSNYDEILFVVVDRLYANNLLIKGKVDSEDAASRAYKKRGNDIYCLMQRCVREHISINKPSTNYIIKHWDEIAESNEFLNLKERIVREFDNNNALKEYCNAFINQNLSKMTDHVTLDKIRLEHDYLFSEITMSIFLTELCGYTDEIWEKPQGESMVDPIDILYRDEHVSLKNILSIDKSRRNQLYITQSN